MFKELKKINLRPELYSAYTVQQLWDDEHISKQMLETHLDPENDMASRTADFIESSVEWIRKRFSIESGLRIADFGCGPGLYAEKFADLGASVTAIDFSRRSIAYAKKSAEKKGLTINYRCENYLSFYTDIQFDLITLIYCDYCALNPEQRAVLLAVFLKHLAPGGSILLDVHTTASYQMREEMAMYDVNLFEGFWSEREYYGFMNMFLYDKQQVTLDKYTIVEEFRSFEIYNWLKFFSKKSIETEVQKSGLQLVECFSDVAGADFVQESETMAVVLQKRS